MNKTKIIQNIKTVVFASVLGIAIGGGLIAVRAWTEPTMAPPGGNIGAPINTGANGQIKSGALQTNGLRNIGTTVLDGNVGIGTVSPTQKLDVAGDGKFSGVLTSGKVQIIDVVTEGSSCSPNGLVARDANGLILSCQSGTWKKAAGKAFTVMDNPPYSNKPGSVYCESIEKECLLQLNSQGNPVGCGVFNLAAGTYKVFCY